MNNRPAHALLAAALLLNVGCDSKEAQPPLAPPTRASTPAPAPSAAPQTSPAPASNATPASPHGTPPASTPAATAAAQDPVVSALGVSLTLPAGWTRQAPSSQMRIAQAEVADANGDPTKASLVVFSSAGGSVQDNVTRWAGQVLDAKGQPASVDSKTLTVAGLPVTVVEMTGSFAGMGDAAPKPDWTLRGGIVDTGQGLLFIKMTGPAANMKNSAQAFETLINSLKKS
jgi:hypothetical protein